MSRSNYSDDYAYVQLWRQAVDQATFGRRGQHFFRRLRAALDAMPRKRLIVGQIVTAQGEVCALGALDPTTTIDPDDRDAVAAHFQIAPAIAAEVAYMNDEAASYDETPENRWTRMRAWVEQQIGPEDR